MHWTQTPEGRERLKAQAKTSTAKRLATMKRNGTSTSKKPKLHQTPAARKKISLAMRRMHAEKKANGIAWKGSGVNGHAGPEVLNGHTGDLGALLGLLSLPTGGMKFAKAANGFLAVEGAKALLPRLDLIRERLVVLIQGAGPKS